jgi:hypothetical protein
MVPYNLEVELENKPVEITVEQLERSRISTALAAMISRLVTGVR